MNGQKAGRRRRIRRRNGGGFGWMLRWYSILIASTLLVTVLLGIGSLLQARLVTSPAHVMKGLTSSVSSQFFVDLLAMEVRSLKKDNEPFLFSAGNLTNFLFRFLMDINPLDPKTLLAHEISGMSADDAVLLRQGTGGGAVGPRDYAPVSGSLSGPKQDPPSPTAKVPTSAPPQPSVSEVDASALKQVVDNRKLAATDPLRPVPSAPQTKKVFIYHSHNRESYLPELEEGLGPDEAFHETINVTKLGARLAQRLNELGVGALSSTADYMKEVEDYNWNYSYKYSLETVKQALAEHPRLEYWFDIHRDAGKRETTTATINGKTYAQVFFVIGHKNPNWQQNEELASKIHDKLEQKYPGISRGVWGKQAGGGSNGEYNQSFSPNSVLIEIGGVENTLEECYRTVDALAGVIADIVREAERV